MYDFLFDFNSNLGPILPRFRDIRGFVRRKPLFQPPNFQCVPLGVALDVWVAKNEHARLTEGEIIFEEFQPM